MVAQIRGTVKWVGERTSRKGKKYYTLMVVQGTDRNNPVFVTSNKDMGEGEIFDRECEITQKGEYLNVYAL